MKKYIAIALLALLALGCNTTIPTTTVEADAATDTTPADSAVVTPCALGTARCDVTGICRELATDVNNCGACGVGCALGIECRGGRCQEPTRPATTCPAGQSLCADGRSCADLTTTSNCGACGNACATGFSCVAGNCRDLRPASCDGGLARCGSTCCSLATDPANCGACGNACAAGQICTAGHCSDATPTCESRGLTNCGGTCVSLNSVSNCGACGRACGAYQMCSAGVCVGGMMPMACTGGSILCGGACVDPSSDAANCGACGVRCGAGQVCTSRVCAAPPTRCAPSETVCGTRCINTALDPNNCGSCGNVCASGRCNSGSCAPVTPTCLAGQTWCSDNCQNLQLDPRNCGSCGHACPTGATCNSGVCGAAPAPMSTTVRVGIMITDRAQFDRMTHNVCAGHAVTAYVYNNAGTPTSGLGSAESEMFPRGRARGEFSCENGVMSYWSNFAEYMSTTSYCSYDLGFTMTVNRVNTEFYIWSNDCPFARGRGFPMVSFVGPVPPRDGVCE